MKELRPPGAAKNLRVLFHVRPAPRKPSCWSTATRAANGNSWYKTAIPESRASLRAIPGRDRRCETPRHTAPRNERRRITQTWDIESSATSSARSALKRRARIDAIKQAARADAVAFSLAEVRKRRDITQVNLAQQMQRFPSVYLGDGGQPATNLLSTWLSAMEAMGRPVSNSWPCFDDERIAIPTDGSELTANINVKREAFLHSCAEKRPVRLRTPRGVLRVARTTQTCKISAHDPIWLYATVSTVGYLTSVDDIERRLFAPDTLEGRSNGRDLAGNQCSKPASPRFAPGRQALESGEGAPVRMVRAPRNRPLVLRPPPVLKEVHQHIVAQIVRDS